LTYIQPVLKTIQEEHIDLKHTTKGHRRLGTGKVIPPLLKEAGVDILISEFGESMKMNLQKELFFIQLKKKDIEEILNKLIKEFDRDYINELKEENFERDFGFGKGYDRGYGRRKYGCGFRKVFGRRWNN